MIKKISFLVLGLGLFALAGCAVRDAVLPLHDEMLIYPLAYDLTYLRTLEAAEKVPGWELEETEKEKGIIVVRNIAYSRFDDADERSIKLVVERIDRKQTSVQIVPKSQRVLGGDKILAHVRQALDAELQS